MEPRPTASPTSSSAGAPPPRSPSTRSTPPASAPCAATAPAAAAPATTPTATPGRSSPPAAPASATWGARQRSPTSPPRSLPRATYRSKVSAASRSCSGSDLGGGEEEAGDEAGAEAGANQAEVEGDGAGAAARCGPPVPSGSLPVTELLAKESPDPHPGLVLHDGFRDEQGRIAPPCRPLAPIPILARRRRERLIEGQPFEQRPPGRQVGGDGESRRRTPGRRRPHLQVVDDRPPRLVRSGGSIPHPHQPGRHLRLPGQHRTRQRLGPPRLGLAVVVGEADHFPRRPSHALVSCPGRAAPLNVLDDDDLDWDGLPLQCRPAPHQRPRSLPRRHHHRDALHHPSAANTAWRGSDSLPSAIAALTAATASRPEIPPSWAIPAASTIGRDWRRASGSGSPT